MSRGVAWELCIAVEGDYVPGALQSFDWAHDGVECRPVATESGVELFELAALPLPPHPSAFPRVPSAGSVKEEEGPLLLTAGVGISAVVSDA